MLLDLSISLELFAATAEILQLFFFILAAEVRLCLCFLGHLELVLEAALHLLRCLPLAVDGGVLFLELGHLASQFLTGGLSTVVQDFCLCDFGCELVEDFFVLHE